MRISDLKTHFFKLDEVGKIMVLGCHDLTVFNPRSDAVASGWRRNLKEEFKRLAKEEKPIVVLHHPHTTDCVNVWTPAWKNLMATVPSVEKYASAGRWPNTMHHSYRKGRIKGKPHCTLEDVLEKTKRGDTVDVIVETMLQ